MNDAIDAVVATNNLRAVAARSSDPELWLGLAFLAQPGDPIRPELSQMALNARPDLGPVASVMANAMDGADEQSAAELIRRDPDNALGYYVLAPLVFKQGTETETLAAFRKGAACAELRMYGGAVSNMLFKALDASNLQGRDRLCASSWMATRWGNFEILHLQGQGNVLERLAKDADMETRKEVSDLMLTLAGQMFNNDLQNRFFGEGVLLKALRLKAEIAAAEKSPAMNGYAAAVQALSSTMIKRVATIITKKDRAESNTGYAQSLLGIDRKDPMQVAQFLPGRIFRAFTVVRPELARNHLAEMRNIPAGANAAVDQAYENWANASRALIEAALPDQDEIIGAFFCGQLPPRADAPAPWSASGTYVERLMSRNPGLLEAVAANEEAMRGMNQVANVASETSSHAQAPVLDRATAAENECIRTLRLIDGAKQQWALEMGKQATDTPAWTDLQPYFKGGVAPKCPSGGTYTLGTVGSKPECSIPGHVCP